MMQKQDTEKNNTEDDQLEFDPEMRPPAKQFYLDHQRAKRVAKPKAIKNFDEQSKICPCCGNIVENEELALGCELEELGFLGAGVPLFFEFLKNCIYTCIIIGGIAGAYAMVKNPSGDGCEKYKYKYAEDEITCPDNAQNKLSTDNRRFDGVDNTYATLNLISTCLCIILTIFFRRYFKQIDTKIDSLNITPADFTIKVKGFPENITEVEVKNHFEHCMNQANVPRAQIQVTKVVLAYKIEEFLKIQNQKQDLLDSQNKLLAKHDESEVKDQIEIIKVKLAEIDKRIEDYIARSKSVHGGMQFSSCGTAFVSFKSDLQTDAIIGYYKGNFIDGLLQKFGCVEKKGFLKNGHHYPLQIQRASEPTDIYWENLSIRSSEKSKFRQYTLWGTFAAIAGSFGLNYLFSQFQQTIRNDNQEGFQAQGLSLGASILILAINGFLAKVVRYLASYEKHSTLTNYLSSVAKKLGFAQFINTAIVSYVVNVAFNGTKFMVDGGMVADITWILLINAFVPALMNQFNPWHLMKLYKQKKVIEDGEKSKLNQQQANLIFEGPNYDLAKQYASVTKTMLSSAFFAYLIPYAFWIAIPALIIFYWQNKYQLLRIYQKPESIGVTMAEQMTDFYLELIILVHGIGCFLFETSIYGTAGAITTTQSVICVYFYFFPFHLCCKFCTDVDRQIQSENYEEVSPFFMTDYDRTNPITQEQAMEKWMKSQLGETDDKADQQKQPGQFAINMFSNLQNYARRINFGQQAFRPQQQSQQQAQNNQAQQQQQYYQQQQKMQQQQRMQQMHMQRMRQQNQFIRQQMMQNNQQQQQGNMMNYQALRQQQMMRMRQQYSNLMNSIRGPVNPLQQQQPVNPMQAPVGNPLANNVQPQVQAQHRNSHQRNLSQIHPGIQQQQQVPQQQIQQQPQQQQGVLQQIGSMIKAPFMQNNQQQQQQQQQRQFQQQQQMQMQQQQQQRPQQYQQQRPINPMQGMPGYNPQMQQPVNPMANQQQQQYQQQQMMQQPQQQQQQQYRYIQQQPQQQQ